MQALVVSLLSLSPQILFIFLLAFSFSFSLLTKFLFSVLSSPNSSKLFIASKSHQNIKYSK